ncbi:unnamed protein product [Polarella glacialis]|uniref:Protein kinase domain-containing protein n=1 Tax=Polarella glacialis TaxID=89957 RepID=A0A813DK79_POLGL|nr:unnamed protein product [Polarella glacialis]
MWPECAGLVGALLLLQGIVPLVQDFFHLCNRALGDQVLEIRNESRCSPAALSMAQLNGGDHQKWRLDSKSRLVSKLGLEGPEGFCEALCLDVAGARDERGSAVIAYRQNEKDNQQWQLEAVATSSTIPGRCRVVKVISQMAGGRALTIESGDQMCRDAALEVHYLARWSDEAGLVRLQRVVWNGGTPKGIIMERLGKQLGKGTGADNKACVLQDIRNGDMSYTAAGAASSLMPVAHVLRRLHRDGYAFNDLHDGNILCCLDNNSYKVIDLGSVTLTGHWVSQLGTDYDGRWSTNRDWRVFGVAFLGLVCGGRQLNLWDLVGTNACTKMHTGAQCPWSAPVPAGDPCVLPADVSSLLVDSGMAWTHTERLNIVSALVAMFAPCINDDDICKKLGVLAGGADH